MHYFFSPILNKMEIIKCECGLNVQKRSLSRHNRSKKHLDFINKETKKSVEKVDDDEEEEIEEETNTNETPETEEEVEEEEETIEEVKPIAKKTNYNKFHLDAIRQKAIEKIKQKKQAKIDKENEIKYKAEQYDHLVKSLKQKEEDEKKKKEEEKIKEMEYKSSQYDKMVKNQQRNTAITSLSNEKIIDDIKEQRLNYLMKYLQNPSYY